MFKKKSKKETKFLIFTCDACTKSYPIPDWMYEKYLEVKFCTECLHYIDILKSKKRDKLRVEYFMKNDPT